MTVVAAWNRPRRHLSAALLLIPPRCTSGCRLALAWAAPFHHPDTVPVCLSGKYSYLASSPCKLTSTRADRTRDLGRQCPARRPTSPRRSLFRVPLVSLRAPLGKLIIVPAYGLRPTSRAASSP